MSDKEHTLPSELVDELREKLQHEGEQEKLAQKILEMEEPQRTIDALTTRLAAAEKERDELGEYQKVDIEEINRLKSQLAAAMKVVVRASVLYDKLIDIEDHPEHKSVWALYYAHGMHYEGPQYILEKRELRKALDNINQSKETQNAAKH